MSQRQKKLRVGVQLPAELIERARDAVYWTPGLTLNKLAEIARQRATTLNDLVSSIDRERSASSLTAAIRVYIVEFYRSIAVQAGWRATEAAGHRLPA